MVKQGKARLALLERQLRDIDADICRRIAAESPTARAFEIMKSIPGLGAVSAAAILIEFRETGFLGRKHLASLAGLAPMTRHSGQWKGKAVHRENDPPDRFPDALQGGCHHLRNALYPGSSPGQAMPTIVAMRFNPDLKAKYQALRAAGKPAKLAITALMRKLVELANTLVKNDRMWQAQRT